MKKFTTKEFVGVSIFAALCVLMATTPQIGFIKIPILPFDITLLFIPVILGTILYKTKAGLILGFVFGVSSLAVAYLRPITPFDLFFQNPIVSVIPRVLLPLVFVGIYKIQERLNPRVMCIVLGTIFLILGIYLMISKWELTVPIVLIFLAIVCILITFIAHYYEYNKVKYFIPTLLSVIIHSIMVISAIGILYFDSSKLSISYENISAFIIISVISNGVFEAVTSSLLIQLIAPRVKEFLSNE